MTAPGRRRYPLLLRLAGVAILWERLWPRLWPAVAIAGVFLTLALLGVFPDLPPWLHGLLLALFGLTFMAAGVWGVRGIVPPTHDAARARIERDSGLTHRPLATLEDELAAGTDDPVARRLWQRHRARMAAQAHDLKVRAPAPGLIRLDPWALRAALILFLAVAAVMAGGDGSSRLKAALLPRIPTTPVAAVTAEIWITPPAYTRIAPLFLSAATPATAPLTIPAGSSLLAQVTGTVEVPRLGIGTEATPFQPISPDPKARSFRLETTIESGNRLVIDTAKGPIAAWPMTVVPDAPPTAAFSAPPGATEQAHLRLPVEAADDYGIKALTATISRAGRSASADNTLSLAIPLPGQAPKQARLPYVRDLTAHLWAGLPVTFALTAEDVAGQRVTTKPLEGILPEREFHHPVARAIVAERRKLADPSAEIRAEVVAGLGVIAAAPRLFGDDTVVFLALSLARARLVHDSRDSAIPAAAELLWDAALRLEDGGLSIAERQLQRIQERLMEALRQGADSQEIQQLLSELEQALADFTKELADELARLGPTDMPLDPNAEILDTRDLQNMIDQIRELAQAGALDAARQRLAELKQLLESLKAGLQPGGPQQQQQQRQSAEAQKLMEALRQLTQRQQELLERTFRNGQQEPGGQQRGQQSNRPGSRQDAQPGEGGEQDEAARQEALRKALGDVMLGFDSMIDSIPEALGRAERAMRRATEALRGGQTDAAVEAQTEALQNLRSGAQDGAQQMARRMGPGMGPGRLFGQRPPLPTGGQPGRDPFGRPSDGGTGFSANDKVKIPDAMDLRQAHDIVRELRRRAGERSRPQLERDYIDRLLRQF